MVNLTHKGQNEAKGGLYVNVLIARLIDCGMPRKIAVWMMRKYKGRERDFERYVEEIEEASRGKVETV